MIALSATRALSCCSEGFEMEPMDEEDFETELVDLRDILLLDLKSLEDSVLSRSIRRIIAEAKNPREAVAGFNAAI
jgi:FXSXX-COOH protein